MSLAGPLVAVVGPTASGKSELAERVACELASSVVSVDAMQVYRGMDIGTAKVPVGERRCPLLMVDVATVGEDYSVKLFQRDARRCVDGLLLAGRVPVLCGGTGLYLNAVVDDMRFPAGERGGERRSSYEELLAREGADALYQLLLERDAASAALIHPHNARRVVRALEMLDEGVSYARHHEGLKERQAVYDSRIWALEVERTALYARIDQRVDAMFDAGLVEEVRALLGQGLAMSGTAGQAIGYKEIIDALAGRMSLDEARALIKTRTRRYAKRQLSWFRHDARVRWLDGAHLDDAVRTILADVADTPVTPRED